MQIYDGGVELTVLLPFLFLGGGLVAVFAWNQEDLEAPTSLAPRWGGGVRERLAAAAGLIGAWFALTALTLWCLFVVAFVLLHALLFTLGTTAASIGLVASAVLLQVTPLAWGIVIARRARGSRALRAHR
jgi:hypothetical protein